MTLPKLKRTASEYALWAALPMAQTSQIEGRLKMILDKTQSRRQIARRVLLLVLAPVAAALILLAAIRPAVKAQTAATPASAPAAVDSPVYAVDSNQSASPVPIQLLGLTDDSKPGNSWWSASGAPLAMPVYDRTTHPAENAIGTTATSVILFGFRLPPTAQGVTVVFNAPNSQGYSSNGVWAGKMAADTGKTEADLNAETNGVRTLTAQYPPGVKNATVRAGVASGPWRVSASDTLPPSGGRGPHTWHGSQKIIFSPPAVTPDGIVLTISTDTPDDLRVVAVDAQGREVLPAEIGSEGIDKLNQITARFAGLPLAQIKAFRVETRPFVWTEFKDVALRPVPVNETTPPTGPVTENVGQIPQVFTPWSSFYEVNTSWGPRKTFRVKENISPSVQGTRPDPPISAVMISGPGRVANFSAILWKPGKSNILTVSYDYTPARINKAYDDVIHLLTKNGEIASQITYNYKQH